jgi:hypothetical protein
VKLRFILGVANPGISRTFALVILVAAHLVAPSIVNIQNITLLPPVYKAYDY